ncbi:MAG: Rpn family recombination-promoting nuclease/putative transposase [Candidatus Accumulibacter sp.]|jgi:predicted transposase/invertase (TIGR01784 family)|nr:Rpn family recombination-promoting nuclease/putative transposase [Accumulibacter sp.]
MTPTPHDALFKQVLGHPETARDFLEIHLPKPLLALCKLDTLRPEPTSFIDAELRSACSDILYSLETTHGAGYIYCLIEHQSTPDPLMAFRLMQYSLKAMQHHLNKNKAHKALPLVIPMLFYHGEASPYPYSLNWLDAFGETERPRARDLYSTPFPLVDVTVLPDDKIHTHKRIALLELVQKHIRQRDLMELAGQIVQLLRAYPTSGEQLRALLNYLLQVGDTAHPRAFLERLAQGSPEYKEEMMTIAERLRMIGREEGLEKGLEKGRQEERLEIARSMLKSGIDVEMVRQITGLSRDELAALRS